MSDTILKISQDYENVIAQVSNPSFLKYSEELANSGSLTFGVSINHPDIENLDQYKKVELFTIENGQDVSLWTGYITDAEDTFIDTTFSCGDEKDFIRNKQLFADKDWTGIDIAVVLNELVTEANARSGGITGNLTYETNLTGNVDKEFRRGTSFFSILTELAKLFDGEFTVFKNRIIFRDTVGEDKSDLSGQFVEFVNNPLSPTENSIATYKRKLNGKAITTSLIGQDSASSSTATFGTDDFGYIERTKKFNDGNLSTQTTEEVNSKGVTQEEIEVTVNTNNIDFRAVDVGDFVLLRIERGNKRLDINDKVKVIKKDVRWINKKFEWNVSLSKLNREIRSTQNFLSDINDRVGKLEQI